MAFTYCYKSDKIMEHWEGILEAIKKLVGTDKVTIYFKENKEEAEVHINDKYWGTYDTK